MLNPTSEGDWHSVAIVSDGNPYGVAEDILFSFPIRTKADGSYEIVDGLEISDYAQGKINATETELLEEKEAVADLLG